MRGIAGYPLTGGLGPSHGDLLLGVLGPEALAGDLHEVSPVRETIESGRGQQGLPEELGPFSTITIRGQENGAALVAFVDDIVEILGPGGAEAFEPEIVEHERIRTRVAGQALLVGAVGAAAPGQATKRTS